MVWGNRPRRWALNESLGVIHPSEGRVYMPWSCHFPSYRCALLPKTRLPEPPAAGRSPRSPPPSHRSAAPLRMSGCPWDWQWLCTWKDNTPHITLLEGKCKGREKERGRKGRKKEGGRKEILLANIPLSLSCFVVYGILQISDVCLSTSHSTAY